MKMLILGYSQIAQRRVIPAAARLTSRIDLASTRPLSRAETGLLISGELYSDYQTALNESDADIVYISLVNSAHADWAEKALKLGYHVIVDKPAFLDLSTAERLVSLAKASTLCLAEATVYSVHPQIEAIKGLFQDLGSAPTRLISTFSVPPFLPTNFRLDKKLGGGALWDLGPYAVSVGRLFFGDRPQEVLCRVLARQNSVDLAFSVLATYSGGRSFVGHFGFDTEYKNRVELFGSGLSVTIDRIFSTPPDFESTLQISKSNSSETLTIPRADSFFLFLEKVMTSIQHKSPDQWGALLLQDAEDLQRLRINSGERI